VLARFSFSIAGVVLKKGHQKALQLEAPPTQNQVIHRRTTKVESQSQSMFLKKTSDTLGNQGGTE